MRFHALCRLLVRSRRRAARCRSESPIGSVGGLMRGEARRDTRIVCRSLRPLTSARSDAESSCARESHDAGKNVLKPRTCAAAACLDPEDGADLCEGRSQASPMAPKKGRSGRSRHHANHGGVSAIAASATITPNGRRRSCEQRSGSDPSFARKFERTLARVPKTRRGSSPRLRSVRRAADRPFRPLAIARRITPVRP